MVVCKFFMQGTCRYGEKCKFEHQLQENSHTSIIRQQNFPTNTNNTTIDTNTLVCAVTNDMTNAEKGGQWLLSCYSPFKEKSNFPGFEEQSFEEIRWNFLEAQRTNTLEQYYSQLQMALQNAVIRIKALQNPTPEIIQIIQSIYYTPTAKTFTNFGNSFLATSNPTSIFAAANQKLFGVVQPQKNFANNQNVFGNVTGNSPSNQTQFGNFPQTNSKVFTPSPFSSQVSIQTMNSQLQPSTQTMNPQVIPNSPFHISPNIAFSTNSQLSNNFTGSTASANHEGIYSKLEDLSEADIKSYESDSFEFGKIPEKPPTYQMCF